MLTVVTWFLTSSTPIALIVVSFIRFSSYLHGKPWFLEQHYFYSNIYDSILEEASYKSVTFGRALDMRRFDLTWLILWVKSHQESHDSQVLLNLGEISGGMAMTYW